MRRSKAPSQLGKFNTQLCSKKDDLSFASSAINVSIFDRSLREINNSRLNRNNESNTPGSSTTMVRNTPTNTEFDQNAKKNIKIYNVVYGKQSKKKHKTWEGDGILEVGQKTATLKDSDGRVMGQTTYKSAPLTEGSRLFVGSKEVEIVDLVSGTVTCPPEEDKKRSREGNEIFSEPSPEPKKMKQQFRVPSFKKSMEKNVERLVMPKPDDEHQWAFNTDYLPVTDVIMDYSLEKILRPHQKEGVFFLYKCVTGMRSQKHMGAILGDEMGLGKTLQCVTLIWTLLKQGPYGGKPLLKRALIVVPSSLVSNWKNEFQRWLGSHKIVTFAVDKNNKPCDYKKVSHVPVLIISYEMLVRGFEDLKDVKFDIIICDEGHRLKNSNIRTATVLNSIECSRRIILTGTPVQNDLQEYYTLVSFVNPGILGSPSEFRKNFEEIIVASRDPEANEIVLLKGEEKAEELNRITSGFILRRTQSVIDSFLPQKYEYVVFCRPTDLQKSLYFSAMDFWFKHYESGLNSNGFVAHLSVITALKKICNHPILVLKAKEEQGDDSVSDKDSLYETLNKILVENNAEEPTIEDSNKTFIVQGLLKNIQKKREKIVLVSNFTQTLDLLASLCEENNFKYIRFDGSTPVAKRTDIVNNFNAPNKEPFVLLLSSKAGGVGLNLIGGSHLVLFDSDWNPATDIQAMARIWREGQKKNVHIYRLLTSGTIEEKIFQRQLSKAGLSESVIDPNCISDVKLSNEDLKDLFSFTDALCLTHDVLKCDCSGNGEIPNDFKKQLTETDEDDERDCELLLSNSKQEASSLRMNQLFHWQHHSKPIDFSLLEEMGLEQVGEQINFVFTNKTS